MDLACPAKRSVPTPSATTAAAKSGTSAPAGTGRADAGGDNPHPRIKATRICRTKGPNSLRVFMADCASAGLVVIHITPWSDLVQGPLAGRPARLRHRTPDVHRVPPRGIGISTARAVAIGRTVASPGCAWQAPHAGQRGALPRGKRVSEGPSGRGGRVAAGGRQRIQPGSLQPDPLASGGGPLARSRCGLSGPWAHHRPRCRMNWPPWVRGHRCAPAYPLVEGLIRIESKRA